MVSKVWKRLRLDSYLGIGNGSTAGNLDNDNGVLIVGPYPPYLDHPDSPSFDGTGTGVLISGNTQRYGLPNGMSLFPGDPEDTGSGFDSGYKFAIRGYDGGQHADGDGTFPQRLIASQEFDGEDGHIKWYVRDAPIDDPNEGDVRTAPRFSLEPGDYYTDGDNNQDWEKSGVAKFAHTSLLRILEASSAYDLQSEVQIDPSEGAAGIVLEANDAVTRGKPSHSTIQFKPTPDKVGIILRMQNGASILRFGDDEGSGKDMIRLRSSAERGGSSEPLIQFDGELDFRGSDFGGIPHYATEGDVPNNDNLGWVDDVDKLAFGDADGTTYTFTPDA